MHHAHDEHCISARCCGMPHQKKRTRANTLDWAQACIYPIWTERPLCFDVVWTGSPICPDRLLITRCLDVHAAKILITCLLDAKYSIRCLLDA